MKGLYNKTNWVDGKTPVNAQNLRKIEQAIYDLFLRTIDKGTIVGKGHITVEASGEGELVIKDNDLVSSKTLATIEYVTKLPEEPVTGILYLLVDQETSQVTKIYNGNSLILERLVRKSLQEVLNGEEILTEGEICVIKDQGEYRSIVIGDGKKKLKELTIIPLNTTKGSVFLGEALPEQALDERGFYIARVPGVIESTTVENNELAILHYTEEAGWVKISLGKFSPIGHLHTKSDITDFPEWSKAEAKPTYSENEIVGLQEKLDKKVDKVPGASLITDEEKKKLEGIPVGGDISNHLNNKENPHQVTKTQVGLGDVDNTSDINKPISSLQQAALDKKVDKKEGFNLISSEKLTTLEDHLVNKNNPHSTTKSQVGLGNVDNTSDADKPVSTLQQQALDEKVDKRTGYSLIKDSEVTDIKNHIVNTSNPHNVTKAQIGLGKVDDTSDLDKPVSKATKTELDKKVDKTVTINTHPLNANIVLNKSDIELENVDNTSDLNKPISTLQQKALDGKVDKREGYGLVKEIDLTNLSNHTKNTENPHNVTKAQVGLGDVDNTKDVDKPISTLQQKGLDKKVDKTVTINSHPLSTNVVLNKSDIGLGNIDNTSDINKPISTLQQTALDKKVDKTVTINGHALGSNLTITKGDIGLGNVDNTSDINKPVSTLQQTALNKKVDKQDGYGLIAEVDLTNLKTHAKSTENPHQVTKAQIGLGKVDDTADLDKPVSKATKTELDKKVDKTVTINTHPLSTNISLSKEDIGLGKVDNTSDLEKPLSLAVKEKLKEIEKITSSGMEETVESLKESNRILAEVLNKVTSRLDKIEEKLKTL